MKIIKSCGNITAAFLNPIVVHDKIFIYHLPLEKYDDLYYRRITQQMIEKHKDELSNVTLLLGKVEEVVC